MSIHIHTKECANNKHECDTCIHEDTGRFENPCKACLSVTDGVCCYEKVNEVNDNVTRV